MVDFTLPLHIDDLAAHMHGQRDRLVSSLGIKAFRLTEAAIAGLPIPHFFILPPDFVERLMDQESLAFEILATAFDQKPTESDLPHKAYEPSLGQNNNLFALRASPAESQTKPFAAVVNLGYTPLKRNTLAKTFNERFASDVKRRFLLSFGVSAHGIGMGSFEDSLIDYQEIIGEKAECDFSADDWDNLSIRYETIYRQRKMPMPPDSLIEQVRVIIERMKTQDIAPTTLIVQAMTYGNMNRHSMAGQALTSRQSDALQGATGRILPMGMIGDCLTNQHKVKRLPPRDNDPEPCLLAKDTHNKLNALSIDLEDLLLWMVRFDFIIEDGQVHLLNFKPVESMSAEAHFVLLVRLVERGHMSAKEAVLAASPDKLETMLHPTVDADTQLDLLAKGLPASPGAAKGHIVFSVEEAEAMRLQGEPCILVKSETNPEDVTGIFAASGVLTLRGGITSHAAVIARGIGKPCVTGAGGMRIHAESGELIVGSLTVKRGDYITIDGTEGRVFLGAARLTQAKPSPAVAQVLSWANQMRRLKVRVNAETHTELEVARSFGAEGVGLCRTEHMLLSPERLAVVREMIVAENKEARKKALSMILPEQKQDMRTLLKIMTGLPVTIRLLDPPLHEFLPHNERDIEIMATSLNRPIAEIKRRVTELREVNPMLGHRGCRLTITFPEILEMQARALLEAAAEEQAEGTEVILEIMVPLASTQREVHHVSDIFSEVSAQIARETGLMPRYRLGAMIETPRAALRADEIAEFCHFFSFGTNDLTQTTYGISRDDATTFLRTYIQGGILKDDPFQTLDTIGVGELMALAVERGRKGRSDIVLGICGEHGGDPKSIAFCESLGLDYVSCSPFRVPIAQLASAQAYLKLNEGNIT